jgi:ArsR family transcriptional regulator, arsenate/arsenite/antimonite-responsive transcriptional repressor / arsenate reductase (thioredoxin)
MTNPLPLEARVEAFAALGDSHRLGIVDALSLTDLTPGDLAVLTDLPTNLLAHHLRILERAGLVIRTRSEGDARRRYVTLASDRITSLWTVPKMHHGPVAFVCTHNSARSQFAAARWEQLTGTPAASAGTNPADAIHPGAVEAALTYGLDLSDRHPRDYTTLGDIEIDVVVSVCDRALEHGLPRHRRHLHWSIPDPALVADRSAFTAAFAQIERRLERLHESLEATAGAVRSNVGRPDEHHRTD